MGTVINAVNRAYERMETRPFWKVRIIAIILVVALRDRRPPGCCVLIVFGGPLGHAIAHKAHARRRVHVDVGHPALADRVRRGAAAVRARSTTSRRTRTQRNWRWVTPGSVVGAVHVARAQRAVHAVRRVRGLLHEDLRHARRRRDPAAVAELHRVGVLFGAELNSELDRQADIHAAGGEHAGLMKPARRKQ